MAADVRWDSTLFLLTWRIILANNISSWQTGFDLYPANVVNMVSS